MSETREGRVSEVNDMKVRINGGLVAYLVGTVLLVVACIHDFAAATSGIDRLGDPIENQRACDTQ